MLFNRLLYDNYTNKWDGVTYEKTKSRAFEKFNKHSLDFWIKLESNFYKVVA
jgi:hypothetical protein